MSSTLTLSTLGTVSFHSPCSTSMIYSHQEAKGNVGRSEERGRQKERGEKRKEQLVINKTRKLQTKKLLIQELNAKEN